jgi:hypothetical protein
VIPHSPACRNRLSGGSPPKGGSRIPLPRCQLLLETPAGGGASAASTVGGGASASPGVEGSVIVSVLGVGELNEDGVDDAGATGSGVTTAGVMDAGVTGAGVTVGGVTVAGLTGAGVHSCAGAFAGAWSS